ncbi:MAG: hypothetical protein CM15mP59_2130 [Flavobacteriaceae bacterium]|nr:MAG: hypothetical protein CM15mP59_2130 [Flavobacteriaceae bacterium]
MLRNLQFGLPGAHNLMNATVAIAMALSVGCDPNSIAKALQTFKGVEDDSAFEWRNHCVLIDDYAHHPTEIDQMAQSIQEFYPSSKKQ